MLVRTTAVLLLVALGCAVLSPGQIPSDKPADISAADFANLSDAEKLEKARELKEQAVEKGDSATLNVALELVQQILDADIANTRAHLLAGEIMIEGNEYDQARDHFMFVVDIEPNNLRANLGLGKIWVANRSWRQARVYLERADRVATDAEDVAAVKRLLALAYAGMGKRAEALEEMQAAVRTDTDDLEVLDTAVEIHLRAASADPRYIEPTTAIADQYLQKAKRHVEEKPFDRERLTKLNRAYDLHATALRTLHANYYRRDVRNQPTDELLPGKEAEAAAALNQIAQDLREQALLRLTMAEHDVLLIAEKAVEYAPTNITYLENLASIYHRVQNRRQAIETYQRILELDPDHAGARQYLESVGARAP